VIDPEENEETIILLQKNIILNKRYHFKFGGEL